MEIIDMHCHVVGHGDDISGRNDVYFNPGDNNHWLTRILYSMIERDIISMGGEENHVADRHLTAREYLDFISRQLQASSEVDAVVLLALDAVYASDGSIDPVKTDLYVSNAFLAREIERLNASLQGKRLLFGASISPNRTDWREELQQALDAGAVLCKIIPSAQHIGLAATDEAGNLRHGEYYRMLADKQLPLLCHVGPEYSYPEGIRNPDLDDYHLLEAPLSCGVTVIAAHCASPVFPVIDRDTIAEFADFMKRANERHAKDSSFGPLYGDTSAFSLTSRLPWIGKLRDSFPPEVLLHGSDFPIPIDGWVHNPMLTRNVSYSEHLEIRRTENPFDKDVLIKRAHGYSEYVLENAARILRLPPGA